MTTPHPIRIVFVEDDEDVRVGSAQALDLAGFEVAAFGSVEAAQQAVTPGAAVVVVSDISLPGQSGIGWQGELKRLDPELPVILVTGHGDIAMAVQAMRDGAYDFIEKPVSSERLVAVVRRAADARRLQVEVATLRRELDGWQGIQATLIGRSVAMQRVRQLVRTLAAAPADVVIYGETGTGKDLVARCLHDHSERRRGAFVPVNCGGLPENLVDSEIFGHEVGAFTGATRRRIGKFEHAHGGTLFLDEIGDMPLAMQARLLRVLQERQVVPLGGGKPVAVDFQLVCATHRRLRSEVEAGRFREDLYYRVNGLTLQLPALRARSDQPALVAALLREIEPQRSLTLAPDVAAAFAGYAWPGNLRQLSNALRTACALLADDETLIDWPHLPDDLAEELAAARQPAATEDAESDLRLQAERCIEQVLRSSGGNMAEAARRLGISRNTLYRKLKARQNLGQNLV